MMNEERKEGSGEPFKWRRKGIGRQKENYLKLTFDRRRHYIML